MDEIEPDMEDLYNLMTDLFKNGPNLQPDELVRQMHSLSVTSTYTVGQMKQLYNQVRNSAGGYSYQIDDMTQLKRFIVLGSETGSFYINAKDLHELNVKCVTKLIQAGQGKKVLDLIEEYSKSGRCPKEGPLLFVLAKCATFKVGDENADYKSLLSREQRQEMYLKLNQDAYQRVSVLCNIPTKLFYFNNLCQGFVTSYQQQLRQQEASTSGTATTEQLESLEITPSGKRKAEEVVIEEPPTPPNSKKAKTTVAGKDVVKRSAGWGRMRKRGIGQFYKDKDANKLLYHLTKYKCRHNWSHKQVLGYAHPKISNTDPEKIAKDLIFTFVTRGFERFQKLAESIANPDEKTEDIINNINVIKIVSELKPETEGSEGRLLEIFRQYGTNEFDSEQSSSATAAPTPKPFRLVFEHIPNGFLKCAKLWEMMLDEMPMMNMIRNLGTMTGLGVFNNQANVDKVVGKLSDPKRLAAARIHPMKILIALRTYEKGYGNDEKWSEIKHRKKKKNSDDPDKSMGNKWSPNAAIGKALDKAFYDSFKQPELGDTYRTGKKFMLALDVSGSMNYQGCVGCPDITPAMASCALALVTWHLEDNCEIVAFGGGLRDIKGTVMKKNMTVSQAVTETGKLNFGATDCAQPMVYALEKNIRDIDVFIVYTDSETYAGNIHPSAALLKYRQETPMKDAKLIVMGMMSNGFTIADPTDPGMLDVVGFDSAVPNVIQQFVKGELSPHK